MCLNSCFLYSIFNNPSCFCGKIAWSEECSLLNDEVVILLKHIVTCLQEGKRLELLTPAPSCCPATVSLCYGTTLTRACSSLVLWQGLACPMAISQGPGLSLVSWLPHGCELVDLQVRVGCLMGASWLPHGCELVASRVRVSCLTGAN